MINEQLDKDIELLNDQIKEKVYERRHVVNDIKGKIILIYSLWKAIQKPEARNAEELFEDVFRNDNYKFSLKYFEDIQTIFQVNKEYWKTLKELAAKYSLEDCTEYLKFILMNDTRHVHKPECLERLIQKLLDIRENDTVMQIGVRYSRFLYDCQAEKLGESFWGYDCGSRILTESAFIAEMTGGESIKWGINLREIDICNKVYLDAVGYSDFVYAYEPQEIVNNPDGYGKGDQSWDINYYIIECIKKKGKIVALVGSTALNPQVSEKFWEFYCENGYVEGVIYLPNSLYKYDFLNSYLVIFSEGNEIVKFYDAGNLFETVNIRGEKMHLLSEEHIETILQGYSDKNIYSIDKKTLKDNNYNLNPRHYRSEDEQLYSVEYYRLRDLIKVAKRGMVIKTGEKGKVISKYISNLKCITYSNISDGVISTYDYFHGEEDAHHKNRANCNDIIISKKGFPFKAAVAEEEYLVYGDVYILIVDDKKIDPYYLSSYFNSELGQKELAKHVGGTSNSNISLDNLYDVIAPVFASKRQEWFNKQSKELVKKISDSYKQVVECKQEANAMFFSGELKL